MKRFLFLIALAVGVHAQTTVYSRTGVIGTATIPLPKIVAGSNYSLLFSVPSLGADARVTVSLWDGAVTVVSKTLHAGDTDLYAPFQRATELRIVAQGATGAYHLQVNQWPASMQVKRGGTGGGAGSEPDAMPIKLGSVVFASDDEVEYIPLPGTARKDYKSGEDWYSFHFDSPTPKLVFFQLELTDRDDLPVDVSVFRRVDGKMVEYTRGQDPVAAPHEVQAMAGNKFSPRLLADAGEYFVRVRANHPEYRLRTRVYDAPPYRDAQTAARVGADYIIAAGDSWFANTPRRGGVWDRVSAVHQETSLCVACHVSHFSQRAQLMSIANGYPLVQRRQLQFLEERFYQNPRPFYGFEDQGAVWSRVISAPANVLSRMSMITNLFETEVSLTPRPAYHQGINEYLALYYKGRDKLPPDETNGNTPLVSTFEVAWYSWKATHDARLPEMIASGEIKNMIDLCYQTLALADIDRTKYTAQIAANAARILSLQREDGQWSMKFDPKEAEVEFQTGHALWALHDAGIPRDNPQVAKAIQYLLGRQQDFGGWMDPLQSFENFRTPFRETQFAVIALSAYYPMTGRARGWNAPPFAALSSDPVQMLAQLEDVWDRPSPAVVKQIEAATQSNDALIRQAATEALGRLALPSDVPLFVKLLGDESKLAQRTAALALRQVYSAHPDRDSRELAVAMASPDARVRWGATRVFAHHFQALAVRDDLVAALAKLTADPVLAVRMQAIRGLWQAWFWNAHPAARNQIEDTLLAMLKTPQHPWIESNLHAAVYNLADENIRYLYNNWVALLGRDEDKDRAIQGRLAVESRLAGKFAEILKTGPDAQKKRLLAALNEYPLRRGDIYEVTADLESETTLVYNRIGNDIEQIAFFGGSAAQLAEALVPLTTSSDAEMSRLAKKALLMVRETPFAAVEKAAGGRPESVRAAGAKLDGDSAKAFKLPVPGARAAAARAATGTKTLDEGYFHANVEPILHKKGPDGYACADCHATHTLFNATWSTVRNVVDTANPEDSLLLRKPTSTAETEGVAGSSVTAHGGGRRFAKGSAEYDTILHWIEGALLP